MKSQSAVCSISNTIFNCMKCAVSNVLVSMCIAYYFVNSVHTTYFTLYKLFGVQCAFCVAYSVYSVLCTVSTLNSVKCSHCVVYSVIFFSVECSHYVV